MRLNEGVVTESSRESSQDTVFHRRIPDRDARGIITIIHKEGWKGEGIVTEIT